MQLFFEVGGIQIRAAHMDHDQGQLAAFLAACAQALAFQALAQAVEICCGFISFYLALPLLEMVLSLLQTMIGG